MPTNKTAHNDNSVDDFVKNIQNDIRRNDALKLIEIFKSATGYEPQMYGTSIIGFGSYHYKYDSGREGDAPLAAFSPRKDATVLYIRANYDETDELLEQLGKCKTSKACIYVKKLDDIDTAVLAQMIKNCVTKVREMYPETTS